MRPPRPYQQQRLARICGQWLSEQNFNVAATVTLCQGRSYAAESQRMWRSGDAVFYDGLYSGLINRLSKALYGRRAYENGARVANGCGLEGDGEIVARHLHIFLERPEWKPLDEFKMLIERTWLQSPWVKPDLKVEEIHDAWVYYSTKEGPDALLLA